jgi:predicted membrane-bound spermidine synthase
LALFKKIQSYLFPVLLEQQIDQNEFELSLYLSAGKVKLYTANTNYSGGKLKKTFQKALQDYTFKPEDEILILGFGMGSIWEIIREEKLLNNSVTGVENENIIIDWINEYQPKIIQDTQSTIIQSDAKEFLKNSSKKFDHIIIDLFVDHLVHPMIFSNKFVHYLHKCLNKQGNLILNTMYCPLDLIPSVYQKDFLIKKTLKKGLNTLYFMQMR